VVHYNWGMSFADQNKALRVILYSLLFLVSFLVFDSITVVITVFFAVVVLGHFLRRAYYKESR
jgi:cobalamin synthase